MLWFALACPLGAQTRPVDINALEQRGEREFASRDCVAAEKTFGEALAAAQAAGEINRTGRYYLRIANCRTRVGDFPTALDAYHNGMAVAEAAGDDGLMALSIHGAALTLMKMGRVEEALSLGQREYELARKSGHPNELVRAMWLVAVQYQATGQARDGLRWMNQALTLSRTTSDKAVTGVILQDLAIAYLALGDVGSAEHLQEEILAIPQQELASMSTTSSPAITYENLGEIQLKAGHPVQARRSLEKAVESSSAPEDWRVHIDSLLELATMQNEAGQIAAADAGFKKALELAGKVEFPEMHSSALQMQSDALLLRGNVDGALEAGAESLRIARQMGLPDRVYKALLSFGAANAAAGEQNAAKENFDEALGIAETLRTQFPGEVSDLGRAFANFIPVYRASVRNLLDLHLPADALQRAEQAKARVLTDILIRGGMDERGALTKSETGEQERLRQRLATANAATSGGSSAAANRTLENALFDYREFRRNLYDHHPELAVQSADFEPAGPGQLAALIPGAKTALLDYFFVPSGVALFVIRQATPDDVMRGVKARISTYVLPDPKHTLSGEARVFREKLANRDLDYKNAARHLFNRLLAPAMADLGGTTDWIISPDGALWDIPFQALIDPAGRHVIETRVVALAPSLTAALQIHQRKPPADTERISFLAMGNPLPSPAPLPDAAREVTEIGTHYPRESTLVLTGASATAAEFRDKAPSARIIHLAAHAGLNDRDPLSSFVSLSGGKSSGEDGAVTALDILSLHLRAEMVVLSACETALGSTGPGEGMIGMGWALSAAGASSSVLSLWKIDSAASREFMTSFYTNLTARGSSVSRSGALRQAGLQMLQSPTWRHPFYWAAFTFWGDGSPRQLQ